MVLHRRKREMKTDYKQRLSLIKSGLPRFVIRKSLSSTYVQLVRYKPEGDEVLFTVSSKDIKKMGWNHSLSNVPCAYLVGMLAGKKAKEKKIEKGVIDFGLQKTVKGSRIYAAVKGLVDAGLDIPHSPEVFPSDHRINGKHISEDMKVEDMKKKILG